MKNRRKWILQSKYLLWSVGGTWLLFLAAVVTGYSLLPRSVYYNTPDKVARMVVGDINFWHLVLNNLAVAVVILVLSAFTLGLVGVFVLLINGLITGQVVRAAEMAHWQWSSILLALAPHGVIEMTSYGLFFGVGIWCSYHIFCKLFFQKPWPPREAIKRCSYFILIAVGLMALAGLIESFVTPRFLAG